MDALAQIFSRFNIRAENLSLLSMHLYEVSKGCREYLESYDAVLTLRGDTSDEREQMLETLTKIDVLLEDIQYHSTELKAQIKDFFDTVEPDEDLGS